MCLTSISIHVTFTAIVPGVYPGEAKICLRLIAETDARSVGDSHPSCLNSVDTSQLTIIDLIATAELYFYKKVVIIEFR